MLLILDHVPQPLKVTSRKGQAASLHESIDHSPPYSVCHASVEWLKSAFNELHVGSCPLPRPRPRRILKKLSGLDYPAIPSALFPFLRPDSRVLELGPGAGSWTSDFSFVSEGEVHAVDFQDIREWINPSEYGGG